MTRRASTSETLTRGGDVPGAETAGPPAGSGVSRFVIVLAVTGTILLALGAFWLSFTTLRDLAVLSGIPVEQAWIWPLIVDGVILEATISVVALRNFAPTACRFAWLLLAAGAGVSVAANITHAVVAADTRVPALIAALVASVPPLVLLAMTHLTVELTRNSSPVVVTRPDAVPPATPAAQKATTHSTRNEPHSADPGMPTTELVLEAVSWSPRTATDIPVSLERGKARARALAMDADGISKRRIAASLGVHPTTVGRWLNAPDRQQDGDPHD